MTAVNVMTIDDIIFRLKITSELMFRGLILSISILIIRLWGTRGGFYFIDMEETRNKMLYQRYNSWKQKILYFHLRREVDLDVCGCARTRC